MRKAMVEMVSDFKKRSRSKHKTNLNYSVSAVQSSAVNLSNLSAKTLNTTYDVLIQDRILQGSNSKDQTGVRKKVVLLLIEVLKMRKTNVKTDHFKKAGIQILPTEKPKGKVHSDLKPSSL